MPAQDIDNTMRTVDVQLSDHLTFDSMLLNTLVLNGLKKAGFKRPSPIQASAVPLARIGIDLIIQAKSGTGKTLVFTIAILESLCESINRPQSIVIVPTREIALQVGDVIREVGCCFKKLSIETFIGGLPIASDLSKVKRCQVVVGTPGRLKHLVELGALDVSALRLFVLDEADILVEKNFISDINFIFNKSGKAKQILACSATFPQQVREFTQNYMKTGMNVMLDGDLCPVLVGVTHIMLCVDYHVNSLVRQRSKRKKVMDILNTDTYDQAIIFSNFQTQADSLAKQLQKNDLPVACLISSYPQEVRIEMLRKFRAHEARILVTTDLAARGIDIPTVNLVINIDCPNSKAAFLHRMGRAGRYGGYGKCYTLYEKDVTEQKLNSLMKEIFDLDNSQNEEDKISKTDELYNTDCDLLCSSNVSLVENSETSQLDKHSTSGDSEYCECNTFAENDISVECEDTSGSDVALIPENKIELSVCDSAKDLEEENNLEKKNKNIFKKQCYDYQIKKELDCTSESDESESTYREGELEVQKISETFEAKYLDKTPQQYTNASEEEMENKDSDKEDPDNFFQSLRPHAEVLEHMRNQSNHWKSTGWYKRMENDLKSYIELSRLFERPTFV
ncbi:ATP-dependent RNA helicase eIF4A-like [Cimex lectularius]|uniref:RNA helicase n=1 Tax=Cimex lectularius TaxID=79782 RepID=A0A8I6REU8_CIMLE|nr:ATP-dependent RNA helicase eIF4A-like [Cimex lectularius]XP_014243844.1 ATP-dependent RNA helicase eIF4A-like [Cimex lectularius]